MMILMGYPGQLKVELKHCILYRTGTTQQQSSNRGATRSKNGAVIEQ